jgi:DNA-binding NarL/FixJ family response regulator
MAALRILIADDHASVRRGIRSLLESHEGWQVSGEATDGCDAVEQAGRLKPDLVVLDVTMPRLNGLEATRRIRQAMPATQVVVLTTHQTDQLQEEARRAGARAVVFKSDAYHSLLPTIESLRAAGAAIHLAGTVVGAVRHIGAFFHSAEERYQVLTPFIVEGLANGEKALHIIDPADRDSHTRQLTDAGVDVDRAEARRELDLASWREAHFSDEPFDYRSLLALIEGGLRKASADGFPMTRLVGMGSRGSVHWDDLIGFESRLNVVLPRFDDVVICAYEVTGLPGDVVTDMMRAHPALVIGGSHHENPFYCPPQRMIDETEKRTQR